jgi:hypothetical protein
LSREAARGNRCNTGGDVKRLDMAADALAVGKSRYEVAGPVSVFLAIWEMLTSYL